MDLKDGIAAEVKRDDVLWHDDRERTVLDKRFQGRNEWGERIVVIRFADNPWRGVVGDENQTVRWVRRANHG